MWWQCGREHLAENTPTDGRLNVTMPWHAGHIEPIGPSKTLDYIHAIMGIDRVGGLTKCPGRKKAGVSGERRKRPRIRGDG
jgi:hypothetical protein